ncbi:hypothetical protein [Paenibacillus sp. MSJ-34]|uniref:hypothetical protein n=1 Tax=Paenibacillus sp. MSJ-34 TaxID=2841529 RepID=UPI001C0F5471|nr:hypothetical protein [Paenibacillus sp. MSJ-34]MBU5442222.1 hypothetical protein [Paenibacillus sp. MSJ-34]
MKIGMAFIMILIVLLTACSTEVAEKSMSGTSGIDAISKTNSGTEPLHREESASKQDMGEAYSLVFDEFMQHGGGLERDMQYLAIELSKIENITAEDKEKVQNDLSKYGVDVLDTTLDELEQEGRLGEARYIEGVLLTVESAEVSDNKVIVKGSVYKSAKGAIGIEVVVEYRDGKWEVAKSAETWIS